MYALCCSTSGCRDYQHVRQEAEPYKFPSILFPSLTEHDIGPSQRTYNLHTLIRKEYEMLRIEFEQNLAANEQTGPINKEMRNLITRFRNRIIM